MMLAPAPATGRTREPGPILIVDDDPMIREAIAEMLGDEGYVVETAQDGGVALEAMALRRFGLVLLDMHMPIVDGWELASVLRERGVAVPIVVMTAGANAADCAAEIGAAGYIPKPFQMAELVALVDVLVSRA